MDYKEMISGIHKAAKNYPDLVSKLIEIGIHSYPVDVATGTILYRLADGVNVLFTSGIEPRSIEAQFNEGKTIVAIRDNQQGKSDYPTFINDIARAGVRFYEATLNGNNKRVTYIGGGGSYEELIRAVE